MGNRMLSASASCCTPCLMVIAWAQETSLVLFELFDPTAYQTRNKDSILQKEQWWKKAYQKLRARHPDRKV